MEIAIFSLRTLPSGVVRDLSSWQDARRSAMGLCIVEYARPEDDIVLAFDGSELIGIALCQLDQDEADRLSSDVIFVAGIATKRTGYGKEFFRNICEYVKECGFDGVCVKSLKDAAGFYQSIGLSQIGSTFYVIWGTR